ncbi:CRISPR-associated protein Cas4 [Mahella sp.]|uniref:CRISPR-associated protein Cas4 n=1 Tax=Mahella sp. TaxID=2798721 RepID=UPI0025C733F9|nr:CRISPR-associated protein Cas4 [Mahella sp.]MBZ4665021.1 CRISPR-associated exonuclease, Cas4 family [Mahella sp.]MDK2903203.1 CRISPR-associated exonuclease Cas4 [Clostridiales bacterium]
MEDVKINGTLIWYYYICPRETWLMARHLTPDEHDENIEWGRFLHEHSYERDKKEIAVGNIKIDLLKKDDGGLVIGEVKKSSKYLQSARMQLLFYLSELSKLGIKAEGQLMFPEEKKIIDVHLDQEAQAELDRACVAIADIVGAELPPQPARIHWCTNCAYAEMCWA